CAPRRQRHEGAPFEPRPGHLGHGRQRPPRKVRLERVTREPQQRGLVRRGEVRILDGTAPPGGWCTLGTTARTRSPAPARAGRSAATGSRAAPRGRAPAREARRRRRARAPRRDPPPPTPPAAPRAPRPSRASRAPTARRGGSPRGPPRALAPGVALP